VLQRESDIGARQRDAFECFLAPGEFGGFGFQEFAPCRCVEIQLAYFHRSALRMAGGNGFAEVPVDCFHFPAVRSGFDSAGESELRYRCHTRQRFTAKAQAGDLLQIVQRGDLAGGMAHQRQRQFIFRNAIAVVANAQQLDAATFQLHCDVGSTRIQTVLQQFLERSSRTLDHLTGGDLVDEQIR
jgi:hypothetical protein